MGWKPPQWPDEQPPGFWTPEPWVPHAHDLCIWKTKGHNCPACQMLSGRIYPLAYWQATVMPGWHEHCDCRLAAAPEYALESPHDLWGTDPFWWDPTQTLWQFLATLYGRYVDWLSTLGERNPYSGFDNLFPLLMSKSGFTTAGQTLMSYIIRVQGVAGIVGNYNALLTFNQQSPASYLPWEGINPTPEELR